MLLKKSSRIAKMALCLTLVTCMIFSFMGLDSGTVFAGIADGDSANLTGLKVIEMYSKVKADSDTIVSDYIASPRELDDYHQYNSYQRAGVPYTLSELRLKDSTALTAYPEAKTKFEALSMAISDQVYDGLVKSQAVFFTGADCDTAVGVAAGIRKAFPYAKIGMVYLDAHGDVHTSSNTTEGTGVATIMGIDKNKTDFWKVSSGSTKAFDGLLLSDGRDLDTQEQANLRTIASSADYYSLVGTAKFKDQKMFSSEVEKLSDAVDVIYLHVDADVLHQAYVSHTVAGKGEGPTIWEMLDNLKEVMGTGKVVAVNFANMYTEAKYTELTANGFTIPEFPAETALERVNRFASSSLLSSVRMLSTTLINWKEMPTVPNAAKVVPATEKYTGNLEGMKVVEIRTRNQTGGLLVGRRIAAPMATDGQYTYEQRGQVITELDHIFPNLIGTPRELDDWTLNGIYDQAGVSVEIAPVVLSDEESDAKYPEYTRYEGLCREISDEVYSGVANDKAVVVVGSGCMPVPAVAGGMRRAYGDDAKLGIVYIDAHGDINTADSTFSGGIGGMDLSPTMGIDPHPTIQHWWETSSDGGKPIDDLLHACARDVDSGVDSYDPNNVYEFGEMLNLQKATSKDEYILNVDQFNDMKTFETRLADYINDLDAVYLHIDMDALDGSFLPNGGSPTGYFNNSPALIGPSVWTVMERIQAVMETGKVAVVNLASTYGDRAYDPARLLRQGFVYPDVEGEVQDSEIARNRANTTAILAGMRVLSSMTSNWTACPKTDYPDVQELVTSYKASGSKALKLNCSSLTGGKTKVTFNSASVTKLKKFESMGYTLSAKVYTSAKSSSGFKLLGTKKFASKSFSFITSKGKKYYKVVVSVMDGTTKVASVTTKVAAK